MPEKSLVLYSCIILVTGLDAYDLFPGYQYYEGFGWLRLHTLPATWADARLRCNMEGGDLASPTTNAVINLIRSTMSGYGLTRRRVFVDIHASKPKGIFISSNGKPVLEPLKWADNEPNNLGNEEDCLVMTSSGMLADESCTSVHPFICIKSNTTKDLKCEAKNLGYALDPHTRGCYKFHPEPVPWRRASMVCAAEHAHLAVIDSDAERKVLMALFAKYPETTMKAAAENGKYAHIGFWDPEEDGEFYTIFGQALNNGGFHMWEPGQPDNEGLGQYCGSMSRTGELNDISCLFQNCPFICEAAHT